jgi:hypothetical protein
MATFRHCVRGDDFRRAGRHHADRAAGLGGGFILEAETFEHPEGNGAGHEPPPDWAAEDGWERTLYTALANGGAGIGFALLLCALFSLRERVSVPQSALWGLAGFVVFCLNPAWDCRQSCRALRPRHSSSGSFGGS